MFSWSEEETKCFKAVTSKFSSHFKLSCPLSNDVRRCRRSLELWFCSNQCESADVLRREDGTRVGTGNMLVRRDQRWTSEDKIKLKVKGCLVTTTGERTLRSSENRRNPPDHFCGSHKANTAQTQLPVKTRRRGCRLAAEPWSKKGVKGRESTRAKKRVIQKESFSRSRSRRGTAAALWSQIPSKTRQRGLGVLRRSHDGAVWLHFLLSSPRGALLPCCPARRLSGAQSVAWEARHA